MIIDWEHHFIPLEIFKKRGGRPGEHTLVKREGRIELYLWDAHWNIDLHLDFMDKAGIDLAVLSGIAEPSLEEFRIFVDAVADACYKHPGRFVGLVPVPPLRVKETAQEMERAIQDLGFRGVFISGQPGGVSLDDRRLWPFYEQVVKYDVPIFVHVSADVPGLAALSAPYDLNRSLGRETELCTATCRLILGGVLEEFPELKIVVAHFGGGVAAIRERIELWVRQFGDDFWTGMKRPIAKSFSYYLGKLYFNMAGYEGGMDAVRCALNFMKPGQLVFATDYPPNFVNDPEGVRSYIANVKSLPFDQQAINGVLGGNAARLLKL